MEETFSLPVKKLPIPTNPPPLGFSIDELVVFLLPVSSAAVKSTVLDFLATFPSLSTTSSP
jgi:hypothetical protein